MVRVKADHNRCWKYLKSHNINHMYPDQLNLIRDEFMQNWKDKDPFNLMTSRNYRILTITTFTKLRWAVFFANQLQFYQKD